MKKWFISDTHFSHTNIIRYTGKPFESVEEMDQALINNWNACIDNDDQIFFLGDFGLGSIDHFQGIYSQLKGDKICILYFVNEHLRPTIYGSKTTALSLLLILFLPLIPFTGLFTTALP